MYGFTKSGMTRGLYVCLWESENAGNERDLARHTARGKTTLVPCQRSGFCFAGAFAGLAQARRHILSVRFDGTGF